MLANGDTRVELITPAQRRKIFACKRELRLTDAQLYFALHGVTGKTSIRALTRGEAAVFIDELVVGRGASGPGRQSKSDQRKAAAGQDPPIPKKPAAPERRESVPPKPTGNVIHLCTDEQLIAIEALLQSLGWGWDAAEFTAIVRKAGIRRGIRTQAEAGGVIEALKAIEKRQSEGEVSQSEE